MTNKRPAARPITATQPACPSWCESGADQHAQEAREKSGSWFTHKVTLKDDDVAIVDVTLLQTFEEQVQDGDAVDRPAIGVSIERAGDYLTLSEGMALLGALAEAILIADRKD